jgi:hypothetical protein
MDSEDIKIDLRQQEPIFEFDNMNIQTPLTTANQDIKKELKTIND